MDNLKEEGYLGAVGKTTGLDFQHCKIVLEEMARQLNINNLIFLFLILQKIKDYLNRQKVKNIYLNGAKYAGVCAIETGLGIWI